MRNTVTLLFATIFLQHAWPETVTIRFVDAPHKALTPVRVELIDSVGKVHIAENAIPISRECAFAPLPTWLTQPPPLSLENPFTGTKQHYVNGVGRYDLKPGQYRLRAFKGPLYEVSEKRIVVSHEPLQLQVEMNRWCASHCDGWASADAHLHLARLSPDDDKNLSLWMAAEGLHIANLLQMGSLTHFAASPQYAFGDAGTHYASSSLLIPGQEHPRTHLLGHAISLGASSPVDEREAYIQYNSTFERIRAAGGISGFAHWGAGPSRDGLALNVPLGNVELLEILSFEFLYLDTWYELLNLGYAITAVAGTDFPCLPGLPGRERTYIRMERPLERKAMVKALREGRTFVSNGPILSLTVEKQGIGNKVVLPSAGRVQAKGHVAFNPAQESLKSLELVHNGQVIRSWPIDASGSFEFHEKVQISETGWVALRTTGRKLSETKPPANVFPAWMQSAFSNWMSGGSSQELDTYLSNREWRGSYAHTSPIYIEFQQQRKSRRSGNAVALLHRLSRIEALLLNGEFDSALIWDWMPYSDGVSAEHLHRNTSDLLIQVRKAKAALREQTRAE